MRVGVDGRRCRVRPRSLSLSCELVTFREVIWSLKLSISAWAEKVSSLVGLFESWRRSRNSCALAAISSDVMTVADADIKIAARQSSGSESRSRCRIWVSP